MISHGARTVGVRAGAGVIFRFIFSGFLYDRPCGNRQPATAAGPVCSAGGNPRPRGLDRNHGNDVKAAKS